MPLLQLPARYVRRVCDTATRLLFSLYTFFFRSLNGGNFLLKPWKADSIPFAYHVKNNVFERNYSVLLASIGFSAPATAAGDEHP